MKKKYSILNFLKSKTFSNELIYECDQSLNYYLMEYQIFELNDENKKVYNKVKEKTKDGTYNYIKIDNILNQGFIVKVATFIEKHTLICDYIRGVFTYTKFSKQTIDKDKNVDSNMDLIISPISETGINNSIPNFEELTNVFSRRVSKNR